MFEARLEENWRSCRERCGGSYRPQAIRRQWIPKPGSKEKRHWNPTVRDRVVQAALLNVLERSLSGFCRQSYGFRPDEDVRTR